MTLDPARELLQMQVHAGGRYESNAARPILREDLPERDRDAVAGLIGMYDLQSVSGVAPARVFPSSIKQTIEKLITGAHHSCESFS